MWISPKHNTDDIHEPLSLNKEVEVFEHRVKGWILNHALALMNGSKHSGFAVLMLLVVYPEMIQQFIEGNPSDTESRTSDFFCRGFVEIFKTSEPELNDFAEIALFYDLARNGMYHSGSTKRGLVLEDKMPRFPQAVVFDRQSNTFYLNLAAFAEDIRVHFDKYIESIYGVEVESEAQRSFRRHFRKTIYSYVEPRMVDRETEESLVGGSREPNTSGTVDASFIGGSGASIWGSRK